MQLWQEPSLSFPFLTLPKLNLSPKLKASDLQATELSLQIPVDEQFLSTWEKGPKNESPKALADSLVTLTTSFNTMIKTGQGNVGIETKSSPTDFVTEMDQGLEMITRVWLNRHFPSHKIVGEEGAKEQVGSDDVVWYIDPIDGTSNFVDGTEHIAYQLGSTYQGAPYIGVMGLAMRDEVYMAYQGANELHGFTKTLFPEDATFAIGTEFRDERVVERQLFDASADELEATQVQVKSIGVNLMHFLWGKLHAFYKPNIKLWDCMAPAVILALVANDELNVDFFIPNQPGQVTADNHIAESLFGNSEAMVARLNDKHQNDSRIGTLIITPKSRPDLKAYFIDACFSLRRDDL